MNSGLELNWIRRFDKPLPLPLVVFSYEENYGGLYYQPEQDEILIDDRYYDLRNGLILVSTEVPEYIPSIIAHEWRHHWQKFQGWKYDGIGWNSPDDGYDEAIRRYFLSSYSEFDALRFEHEYAKSELNDYWRGLILNA